MLWKNRQFFRKALGKHCKKKSLPLFFLAVPEGWMVQKKKWRKEKVKQRKKWLEKWNERKSISTRNSIEQDIKNVCKMKSCEKCPFFSSYYKNIKSYTNHKLFYSFFPPFFFHGPIALCKHRFLNTPIKNTKYKDLCINWRYTNWLLKIADPETIRIRKMKFKCLQIKNSEVAHSVNFYHNFDEIKIVLFQEI